MSEKRFKVCIDSNNGVGLYDNSLGLLFIKFTNKEYAVSCRDSLKYLCNLMNELYDENEQLKQIIQKIADLDGLTVEELFESVKDVPDEVIMQYLRIFYE